MKMQEQIVAHRQQAQQRMAGSGDEAPPAQLHFQLQNQLQPPRPTAGPEEYHVDRTSGASLCSVRISPRK
jgi:hypothetical protein